MDTFLLLKLFYLHYILNKNLLSYRMKGSNEIDLFISSSIIIEVLTILKTLSHFKVKSLMDIAVIDLNKECPDYRFRVVYVLIGVELNFRVNVHCCISEKEELPSIVSLYPNALWHEREVFDMFGICFTNNPDLRRLLSDYQFRGFALRKDFPLVGFVELFYYDTESRIIYKPVTLLQELKQFTIGPSWASEE